jgi:hypothetical protein
VYLGFLSLIIFEAEGKILPPKAGDELVWQNTRQFLNKFGTLSIAVVTSRI